MLLFGVEIPRERLLIAVVCIATAVLLMLFLLVRWIVERCVTADVMKRGFQPEPYTAHRKRCAPHVPNMVHRLALGTSQFTRTLQAPLWPGLSSGPGTETAA